MKAGQDSIIFYYFYLKEVLSLYFLQKDNGHVQDISKDINDNVRIFYKGYKAYFIQNV